MIRQSTALADAADTVTSGGSGIKERRNSFSMTVADGSYLVTDGAFIADVLSMKSQLPNRVSVTASTDGSVFVIQRADMLQFFEHNPGIYMRFIDAVVVPSIEDTDKIIDALKLIPLFCGIDNAWLQFLSNNLRPLTVPVNCILLPESETNAIIVLIEGSCSVFSGNKQVGVAQAGDSFGEIVMEDGVKITGHTFPRVKAIASENCIVMKLTKGPLTTCVMLSSDLKAKCHMMKSMSMSTMRKPSSHRNILGAHAGQQLANAEQLRRSRSPQMPTHGASVADPAEIAFGPMPTC